MPVFGTPKKINPMRINNPKTPLKNVTEVFTSPFNTLVNVVFKYKNGQIQARIVIKFPANGLEKTNSPKKFPNIKKKKRHPKPRKRQKEKVCLIVFFKTIKFPSACDSETAGKSIIAIELVNAFGKRKNGSAIPFNIP